MLLAASGFVEKWWWAIAVLVVLLVVTTMVVRRTGAGKAQFDALLLKLPVVGSLIQAAIVERICRVLASLVVAGVDLPRACR